MKKLIRMAVPMLAMALTVTQAHAAGSQEGTYVVGTAVASTAGHRCVTPAQQCVALLGAFQVPAGPTAITMKITDVTGQTGIEYSVCQDNSPADPSQPFCGDGPGDVEFLGCTPAAAKTFSGFKTSSPINVFLFGASTECEGVGTAGTYKVTW